MAKIKAKIVAVVILQLYILVFFGCTKRNPQPTSLEHQVCNNIDTTIMNEEISPTLMPEEECKSISIEEILCNAINDELWFEGKNRSIFRDFEKQDFHVEIYKNADIPEEIWVMFYNKNEEGNSYYITLFESDSRGILNERKREGTAVENDYAKAIEKITNNGFSLVKKTEIHIGEVQKPNYTGMTEDKKKIADEIEVQVKEVIKLWKLEPGLYRIYIRDFRDNSRKTYVAVQYNAEYWMLDIYFYDKDYIAAESFYSVDNEVTQRMVELIKSTALLEKDILIEYDN